MALLCFNSFSLLTSSFPPSSSSFSPSLRATTGIAYRFHTKCIDLTSKSLGVRLRKLFLVNKTDTIIVRAASDVDGAAPTDDGEEPHSESKEEVVPVEKLPLESKLQQIQVQRLRMKLAKKIRLRRKRLVQKRRLRKKGRWPPSKMKKLKNV